MVFVLASAGLAAVAVGRSVYRHVMNIEQPPERQPGEDSGGAARAKWADEQSDAWTIPDLDVPDGWGVAGEQLLLTSADGAIGQLASWLPRRHSIARWTLLFSTGVDGYSLATLYRRACDRGPLLLLVRDTTGSLFGAYIAHALLPPHPGHSLGEGHLGTVNPGDAISFHGHGETFLFEVLPMGHLPPLLDGSAPPQVSVCAYRWAHADDLFVASHHDFLAIGGGGGHYGLRLDGDLQRGRTGAGATFRNPPLGTLPLRARARGEPPARPAQPPARAGAAVGARDDVDARFFDVAAVEVWSVDDWALHHPH
ncbi:hypothetical protein KFE25_008521 [Diacronema lutheri]|uniref:Oxidation resistance protein 1 n=1 Tax=Diacronema lutheri TaxID=2081491 RepID=A0A8J5XY84_DIALT|nr:hypothetical protein KFE25_008521 [Diacronema lutheri]